MDNCLVFPVYGYLLTDTCLVSDTCLVAPSIDNYSVISICNHGDGTES